MHTSFYVHLYMYAILKSIHLYWPAAFLKNVHLYQPFLFLCHLKKCTPIYVPFWPDTNCVHLYRPPLLPAGFKKCTPIPAITSAGNLSKMHTYIYPALSCCKLCTPIPAPAIAGSLFKLCIPIYTQTPPRLCRQPSRFERLCPELVASIGAHFFCLFLFAFFRRLVCCYMCTLFERRYLPSLPASVKVYTFYIQTPLQGYYMYTYFERLLAAAFQVKVYIF